MVMHENSKREASHNHAYLRLLMKSLNGASKGVTEETYGWNR